ncbi:MAG: 2-isopropylmalate synthase [gamma proteobacterium symbiont of Bathyaustriella thionipta]|nr:2-isopropylmalate synthase [gamma proteobacterium symbiont of Bathyaustriella thionipta]MCU7950217.1 2-isopropylmalate synthase [gamma proteobacterium symbiont of Bathyaustriella thionipta]MCU7952086.1 2-isopropylmalate synthase [gamma proteobacterium symbiont of Bathyaustriella thionipta]MCU7956756.1 2-isopropylmalate synthase [gamma proteobacterium symbiont of Bathyaustriella thionipta]MCU7965977.1 2-isopropylmalate synthase [gamma proteobacterium symbiont of Bathyaustriella thionipta]
MNTPQNNFNHQKYQAFKPVNLVQRQWPNNVIDQAPEWCSVDLRDGNQALIQPLSVEQKMRLFKLLLEVGFKEIEVGFPSASQSDYDFVRELITGNHIPDDVTIAILTPARESFIQRSFEALKGVKKALVHLYNSTSKVQREQVFKLDKAGITQIAVDAAKVIKQCARAQPQTQWKFQYSPESFTATELDYAVEICNAVNEVWQPTIENPVILNLPSTVEMSMPNVYADQIEWFAKHIAHREGVIISVHTHNDRGSAIAAAEMAVLAGAQRVEGTLLGNGERTGNMDIITMAMNLYSQGIDPQLDLSNIQSISEKVSQLIQIAIHPRHPYIGKLVFTAFSGSHQDAINKCMKNYQQGDKWEVAYLPIDPTDLGRSYEEVIRINSQSGKGGVAYLLEQALSIQIPRWLQIEFSQQVQVYTEKTGQEVSAEKIIELFQQRYLMSGPNTQTGWQLCSYEITQKKNCQEQISVAIIASGKEKHLTGEGVGALDAFVQTLAQYFKLPITIIEFSEQAMHSGSDARAMSFICLKVDGQSYTGVAEHNDVMSASLSALLNAMNEYFFMRDHSAVQENAIKKAG